MNDNFSSKFKDVLVYSKEEALRLNHERIGTEHILLGILRKGEGKAIDIFHLLQVDLLDLRKEIEGLAPERPFIVVNTNHVAMTKQVERILKITFLEARLFGSTKINTAHLLLCILRNINDRITKLLSKFNVDYKRVMGKAKLQHNGLKENYMPKAVYADEGIETNFSYKGDSYSPGEYKKSKTPVLDNFGRDFTLMALHGKLDPVIGRDKEVERSMPDSQPTKKKQSFTCRRTRSWEICHS